MFLLKLLSCLVILAKPLNPQEIKNNHLIGYDCSNPESKTSVIDLTTVQPCTRPTNPVTEESAFFQVIQTQLYRPVHLKVCLVQMTRIINFCGRHGYITAVENGFASKIVTLGRMRCAALHESMVFSYGAHTIDSLKANSTTTRSIPLTGSASTDGYCSGGVYSDDYGTWSSVVVQAIIKITLEDYYATIITAEERVIMPRSGIHCPVRSEYCMDSQQGEMIWTYKDAGLCSKTDIDVLFEGKGTLATISDHPQVLIVKENTNTFALKKLDQTYLCGRTVYRTEHGRIFISQTATNSYVFSKETNTYLKNIDLTSHISSKFLYITQAIHQNLVSLIADLNYKDCETRKLSLENRLALATLAPEFIGMLTEGPGYYGRVLGEVLYIIKCVPVAVQLKYTPKCYQEIPVTYNNDTRFLSPVTHLIIPLGREIPCQAILHPKFMLGSKWYIRNPDLVETPSPKQLNPDVSTDFSYSSLIDVSAGGLYSQEQLRSLQMEMMLPSVREAVNNGLVRRVQHMEGATFDTRSLWTDADLTSLTSTIAGRISWFFAVFGNYASTLIGVYMCWKLVVYLIGVITNCCVLRKTGYSFKFFMLGLIDSLTSLVTTHKDLWKKPFNVECDLEKLNTAIDTQEPIIVPTAPEEKLYPPIRGPTRTPVGFFRPTASGLM
ncbi:putative glycoprotein [Guangdong red-banded snake chuvirus-like virus]|uniref:Putative glycoprotein n=1 Tax=Guangdong red-banded snake chuvirus-like virus TaxID=2116490 RepID=A0A2P1GMQ2_9VIRU|nr:putative glycoprotein [Guangdong red-banded snake chuvirus-like virus]AVM87273.1 putative glycoprotein [Guangdong red-banded snake chuvirus-like virus]